MDHVSDMVNRLVRSSRRQAEGWIGRLPAPKGASILQAVQALRKKTQQTPPVAAVDPTVEARLDIPFCDISQDEAERQEHQVAGQFLARQDRWDELAERIRRCETSRQCTAGGMPVADLLTYGARADVVYAAEDMVLSDGAIGDAKLLEGITALEDVLRDHKGDYAISLVVALAHIDIGWIRRSCAQKGRQKNADCASFAAHFERAIEILDGFCAIELSAPGLAAARCALLAGLPEPANRVVDDYEDLIDLDPDNYRNMRAMGNHLLPQWFGSYERLELEARRTAGRTYDIWGNGAYTWVMFDAIALDDTACARVDVAFFIDGLHDILTSRSDQATANLLASYCSTALARRQGVSEDADIARQEIMSAADWIIRDHLTEVHPLVWAHAAEGFDNAARVTSINRFAARGRANAQRVIGDLFREDLERGRGASLATTDQQATV
ncbi:hypothetical protein [Thalassococcus sp. S3]|uniref:hypothetical protein n=1 Tax=Thalassococcus sp. S3 TaxID=2017482 RepID=UPI00102469D6|nr:hypothetical protein [Thalassococcus sp. S3]QBF31276.1 hypothetical protein CFI11_08605 [Thalassococcus sp. S3]